MVIYYSIMVNHKFNSQKLQIESEIDNLFKVNNNTCAFHSHDMGGSGGAGKRYVISKMCGVHYKNNTELYDKTTNTEIDFQICLSRFVTNLTRMQQKEFGELMNYISKIFVKKEIIVQGN